jgi:hypothetical protein
VPLNSLLALSLALGTLSIPAPSQDLGPARQRPMRPPVPHPTQPPPFPPASDRRGDDFPVHQETHGGARQELIDLSGSEAGYAGLWRDTRDGNLGLYFCTLDRQGQATPFQRAIHEPSTARELEPAIAFGPGGVGAVAWYRASGFRLQTNLRFFGADHALLSGMLPVGAAGGPEPEGAGEPPPPYGPSRTPALAFDETGAGIVAWREGGVVFSQRIGSDLEWQELPRRLSSESSAADRAPRVAAGGGRQLVAWSSGGRTFVDAGAGEREVGAGLVQRVLADPIEPGWWLLGLADARLLLYRLAPDGVLVGSARQLLDADLESCDFALFGDLLLFVTERAQRGDARHQHGPIELWVLSRNGLPVIEPVGFPDLGGLRARGPRIAVSGASALVAWTDERNGDPDVYCRLLRPGDLQRADQRWNDDQASADQAGVSLASDPALRAVATWEDRRDGPGRIYARLIAADGLPLGDEFRVSKSGLDPKAVAEVEPAAAMLPGGRFALQWSETAPSTLCLRLFGADSKPVGETLRIAGAAPLAAPSSHAILALPEAQAYLRVWVAEGGALWHERRGALGQVLAAPALLQEAPAAAAPPPTHPATTLLSDGRVLVLWEERQRPAPGAAAGPRERGQERGPEPGLRILRGRLLGPDGLPRGAALTLPGLGLGGGDIQPVAAPAGDGGFWLAFSGNEGPVRDIYLRRFDRRAEPVGEPLLVSTHENEQDYPVLVPLASGDLAVVYEDDLSGVDLIVARRLGARGRLGPPMTLNQLLTRFLPDRTLPAAVALGEGLLVGFEDRRRAQGTDVYLAVFGPAFDQRTDLREPPR